MTTPSGSPEPTFRHYNAEEAREFRAEVESIYVDSYATTISDGNPFSSAESFMHRFDAYSSSPTFDLVVAFINERTIGQTWGWPLTERASTSGWWAGILTEPEPEFTWEDGRRTFALSEIMVRKEWTGRGVARRLHDTLLSARTETRATLLVRPENTRARQTYLNWGWAKVAQLRPGWDSAPLFDVLILPLPISSLPDHKD